MIRFLCFFILISSSVMNLRAQESPVLKLSLQEILDLSDKQSHTLKKGNYNIERVENELAASRLQWAPELSLSVSAGYLGNATLTNRDFSNREVVDMPHFSNKLVLQLGDDPQAGLGQPGRDQTTAYSYGTRVRATRCAETGNTFHVSGMVSVLPETDK